MSGVVTFLKKLGTIIVDGAAIAVGLQPFISPLLGSGKPATVVSTATNDLQQIAQLVVLIETALQGKAGTDKLAALVPLVTNVVATSELLIGKKVANDALFKQACTEYAQATVDLLNSIDQHDAKTA